MDDAAGHPSEGWVVWTFLSSLGQNEFFSSRQVERAAMPRNHRNALSNLRRLLELSTNHFVDCEQDRLDAH